GRAPEEEVVLPTAIAEPEAPPPQIRRDVGGRAVKRKKTAAKKSRRRGAEAEATPPMKGKAYDKELRRLQVELCHLQDWVKAKGERVVVVLEGGDAAGKGGVIKALPERVSPRVFRVIALPVPSDREKTQIYVQRYLPHFPAAGEVVIFDRSWYNR